MTNQKSTKGVILLDGARLYWYQEGLANILTIDLPAGSIQYFEVLKKDDIYQTIKTTIEQQKIPPAEIILLLSSKILFVQEFPKDTDAKKNQAARDTFLSTVPFEDVSYTSYIGPKSIQIAAANQELYQTVVDVLVSCGFTVAATTPAVSLGQQFNTLAALDQKTAQTALSKGEVLKKNSLTPIKKFEILEEDITPEPVEPAKKQFSRVYLLAGVFGILLLILGYMVFAVLLAPTPKPHPKPISTTQSVITPSPTPVAVTTTNTPTDVSKNASLSAQIVYTNSLDETTEIQDALKALGITKITVTNGKQIAISKTQITVDPSVTSSLKEQLIQDLERSYESVSVQESNLTQYDIIITTGTLKATPNTTK